MTGTPLVLIVQRKPLDPNSNLEGAARDILETQRLLEANINSNRPLN